MKSALVFALVGSAVAAPSFGDFLEALFGGNDNDNRPHSSDFPNFPPIGTGSGLPFPFPTATGAPFPTGTSDVLPFPYPGSDNQAKRQAKALHIDYQLAPTATPVIKRRELKYRQLGDSALPSFSLLDPNDTPTATESATVLPTELPTELPGLPTGTGVPELPSGIPTNLPGLPTGFPTPPAGGPTALPPIPTGEAPSLTAPAGTGAPGSPSLPTTFGTVTRGPRPTAAPESPEGSEGEETENGNAWLEWVGDLLTGGKGSQN
ncbi:hypothetical protein BU25DRAFT_451162 [Macroventuria anomochaeta]|uniref:Uncharacterized protein n=1 Tax=Macroventuria anomochaeta TaxID=301207 RepID=A0ACB6RRC0_9PLEO|nr:uncharacterized protein BU25DRAFT_451162 [Macroventuria anomochaeta]KAF2623678.1 hypothetical protein BU25DRAFT_451162 [Macroventuria anomochaeta]